MATFVIKDPVIVINSVDLSDHITSVEINDESADVQTTNFGSSGNVTRVAGLKDGSITIEFQQDYAASEVDATLWAARGTVIPVTVKAVTGSVTATNPLYSGSYLVTQYKPITGKVGDLSVFSITWPRSGDLTRSTT